ncbi:RsiV family protein [Bacillus piscicola]|uniref:RsiV family protein n=1 Tax=Bacillus piscicola TaxID=1632684 RepID=UPI001F08E8A0|nr:RsiV family protein [Bacillus piscicola]
MDNFYQRLPVQVQTHAVTTSNISVFFPYLLLYHPSTQQKLNNVIHQKVNSLFQELNDMGYYEPGVTELIGNYEIKNNQQGIVSFTFSLFANKPGLAHPVELMNSLTANVNTGEVYQLHELFKPGSNANERINTLIEAQIKERQIPVLEEFPGISANQKFYVADQVLVVYFDKYEITPGYVGFPTFPIPIYQLEDLLREDNPFSI